jgi:hypothetical protein
MTCAQAGYTARLASSEQSAVRLQVGSKRLSESQSAFARLVSEGATPTDAYIAAFPACSSRKAARTNASRLMKHPMIAGLRDQRTALAVAAIDRAVERYAITAERVAEAMARLAFTDIDQVASVETVNEAGKRRQSVILKDFSDIERAPMAAISEVRRTASGEVTVKLYNKREALLDLARLKGWIADKPVDQRSLVVLKVER